MTTPAPTLSRMRGFPLLGHVPHLLLRPLNFLDSLRHHGDIVVIRLGTKPVYMVNRPDLITRVLIEDAANYDKGVQFDKLRPLLGNGLVMSEGSFHLRQRRLVQPLFHRSRIAEYAELMRHLALDTMGAWLDGQEVAMNRELHALTLKTVIKTLFSTEVRTQIIDEVERSLPILLTGIGRRAVSPADFLERLPTPSNLRFNAALRRIRGVIDEIIREYRHRDADTTDLLSMLLRVRDAETNEGMTDQQVHDEAMTMMVAGSETTANAMSWACHLLAEHPDHQHRVQREIDDVLAGRPITIDDLDKLTYMRQVIRETLRLYPPAFILTRRANTDAELGGHRVPAGSMLAFSIYALHRNPAIYPAPAIFDPDRWLPERAANIPRNAYMPFGTGVRGCIGEPFALLEMQIALSCLAATWTIRPVPGSKIKPITRTVLVPDHLPLTVHHKA